MLAPLAGLGVLLVVFTPRLRANYTPLVLIILSAATVSAFIAEQSGQELSQRVGLPSAHATQGERLPKVLLGLTFIFLLWFLIDKSRIKLRNNRAFIQNSLKLIATVLSVTSFALTFIVGHSGATATWKDRIATTGGVALEDSKSQGGTASGSTSEGAVELSNSQVTLRNSASACWSIVNGNVYNLTSFIQEHPGGVSVISDICGKDGTKAFTGQHGTQAKPNDFLRSFLLGPVGGQITLEQSKKTIAPPSAGYEDD